MNAPSPPSNYDAQLIQSYLNEKYKAKSPQILVVPTLPSTNDYLLKLKPASDVPVQVCIASEQTNGRGRHGKEWVSPADASLCCSIRYPLPNTNRLASLSIAVAIMLVEGLRQLKISAPLQIKWPNDVLCNGKKLAGILIETTNRSAESVDIVVGFGLNLRDHALLPNTATALKGILNGPLDENEVAGRLINQVLIGLDQFVVNGMDSFLSAWSRYDYLRGLQVKIVHDQTENVGLALGITAQGELILQDECGIKKTFRCGEASVRPANLVK